MLFSVIRYLLLPIALASSVFADVHFTFPAAGTDVPVGTIDVRWKESGTGTPIADLTQYTLALYAGGNQDNDMLQLAVFMSGGNFVAGNKAQGTISAGIAGPISNGL